MLESEDADDIRAKTDRLQTAFHKVSEAMYERARPSRPRPPVGRRRDGNGAAPTRPTRRIVDAEVVDEQK